MNRRKVGEYYSFLGYNITKKNMEQYYAYKISSTEFI